MARTLETYTVNERTYDSFQELLNDAKKIHDSNDDIQSKIAAQMEWTRQDMKLTASEFAQLLGTSLSTCHKQLKGERPILFATFLTFCRIFGFDISDIVGRAYLDSEDSVLRETAVLLSGLSDKTIDGIIAAIDASEESAAKKTRASTLLNEMKKVQGAAAPLFLADNK